MNFIGGMMSLSVKSKTKDSVKCVVVDGGELKSRRHLNVRGKSATLPSITGFLSVSISYCNSMMGRFNSSFVLCYLLNTMLCFCVLHCHYLQTKTGKISNLGWITTSIFMPSPL